jgi:oligosaccharide repeat unit polymerase
MNRALTESAKQPLPWWTSPAGISVGFLIPLFLLIAYSGSSNLPGLTVRGLTYLRADYLLLGVAILIVLCITGWVGSHISFTARHPAAASEFQWDRAALVIGLISLFAYLYFFKQLVLNPVLLFQTFTGAYRPDRTNLELTSGITSLDNWTPVFFSIYAYRTVVLGARVRRHLQLLCVVLLCATALRVYAWSERLALIEATIPFGLAYAARFSSKPTRISKIMLKGGPFLALPTLILYFGIAEYFRSWRSLTYNGRSGFWEFAVGRMASYYYTSLNNGAGILATSHWPSFQFEYTLLWLHRAPLFGPLFSSYVDLRAEETAQFLVKYGDREFNNPSGIYSAIYDLGLPLGILYFAIIGWVAGALFTAYRSKSVVGVLGYPLFFLSYLEIFRYPYLGSQRGFTWALGIGIALILGGPWLKGAHRRSAPSLASTEPHIER